MHFSQLVLWFILNLILYTHTPKAMDIYIYIYRSMPKALITIQLHPSFH